MKIVDVKKDITFAQRIELGNIFQNDKTTDYQKFEKAIRCLYDAKIRWYNIKRYFKLLDDIVSGLAFWVQMESKELKNPLTIEQEQAGYGNPSKWSTIATADIIATKYGIDPDTVLKWKYGKVFGILAKDLEDYKKSVKYQKIMNK